ncbi:MAG: hypothetical protein DRI69_01920 [Bacteroidetes bacterium]|nr:MAG: hypothetical protein DRI69_01920 [Bacteroidota bacterium]
MICTVFEAKLSYGQIDGTSISQPDDSYDLTLGYYAGFRLLVEDGTSWICEDASAAAAVWNQDESKDAEIYAGCRAMTERLIIYLDDMFPAHEGRMASSGITFDIGGVVNDDNSGFGVFYPGDTIQFCQTVRNDGYYDVTEVAPGVMTVTPEFPVTGADEGTVYLYAAFFPTALSQVAARMVAYDVYSRSDNGMSGESIGSYSYTKSLVDVAGLGYPTDVTAGLMTFKRPKIR